MIYYTVCGTRDRPSHKFGHCAACMWNSNEKIYHTDQKCGFLFTALHCLAIICETLCPEGNNTELNVPFITAGDVDYLQKH